jgi:DNA-binding transcriptional LysR family regulator
MLAPAERVEDAALDASREVERAEAVPAGRVRLTTIEVLASRVVAPILRRFHERYPLVQFDIICTPRVLDLARGEADLALRVGRPTEPSLIARRLSTATERPYAAQRWLDRRGLLPEEITSMDGLEVLTTLGPDSWHGDLGEADTVLRSTNASTLIAAAAAGLGVAMVPDLIAEVTPGLVPLDGLGAVRQTPIWLVMHRDLSGVARVRAVADYLVERLALPGGRARAPALSSDG